MTLSSMTGPDPDAGANFIEHFQLIGRAPEQAALRAWLQATQAGQGRGVLVSGEAGIGKTSLVEDLAREAESQGCLVLWGHAYDFSVTPPYGPWVELARTYQPAGDLPPFPAFLHDPQALAAVGSQEALFAQTWHFFATLAAQRPVVLILDDLHWADPESLSLLRFIAREVTRHRVLILATYRSDELTRRHALYQLVPLLVREAQVARLELHPLDNAAIHELITKRCRLPEADTVRLETYLNEHAEGNPLYAGELLRTLAEDRVLSKNAAGWSLGDLSQVRLPPLLMQVIEGRLARLSEATRRWLEVAAVIGQTVPLALWQRVSDADENGLAAVIEQGMEARLLAEGTSGTLQFSHALVREALYQGTVLVRRRGWHRAIGEALATAPNADPDTVAHHFEEAGDPRAIDWLLRAGERAAQAYALRTAVTRLEVVLRLQEAHGVEIVPPQGLLLQMSLLLRFSDAPRALSHLDAASALAEQAGDRVCVAWARAERGYLRFLLGELRGGLGELDAGVAECDRLFREDPAAFDRFAAPPVSGLTEWGRQATFRELLAGRRTIQIAFGAQVGRLEQAVSLDDSLVDAIFAGIDPEGTGTFAEWVDLPGFGPYQRMNIALGLGIAYGLLGRVAEARMFFRLADRAARPVVYLPFFDSLVAALELAHLHLPFEADQLLARQDVTERAETAWLNAGESVPGGVTGRTNCLPVLALEGRWWEACELATTGRLLLRDKQGWLQNWATATLAMLSLAQGDRVETGHCVADVLPDGPTTEPGDCFFVSGLALQRVAAEMALETGDLAMARDWLEAHDRWLEWSGAVLGRAEGALGWAAFHHANDDPAQARIAAEQALAYASDPRQPLALIAVHRFLGTLDTEEKQVVAADEHLQQSLTLATACAAPFERALTSLELARLRTALGQPETARTLLTEVREICTPLEALPTLARVATLEAELSPTPVVHHSASYPAGLTAREVEVLRLLTQGLSNPEIAERLFLSRRTVDTHLSAIYRKLDVTSRIAAVRFATEHGLG